MTVPEWVVITVLTAIGVVFWWGVKRLVKANDDTSLSLAGINNNLSVMNGRLGKSEMWMTQHEKQDDSRHVESRGHVEALWTAVSGKK